MGNWSSENIIELVALIVAIPGGVVAVATLWMLMGRHKSPRGTMHSQDPETLFPPSDTDYELAVRRAASRFQDQYTYLHRTVTAERSQWAEEMIHPHAANLQYLRVSMQAQKSPEPG